MRACVEFRNGVNDSIADQELFQAGIYLQNLAKYKCIIHQTQFTVNKYTVLHS